MKKKIISRKEFFINSEKFKKNITKNKKVQKLANSLMIESDKENWAYQHTWMNEPMLQTPEDIIKFQGRISGLVVEFHNVDLHKDLISKFINNFDLTLCHVHGQNPSGTDYLDDNNDPTQIEMTFSNTKNILSNIPKIPHPLDQPADFRYKDIDLKFIE